MFHHVVLFRWRSGTTPEAVEAIRSGLDALPGRIPEIRSYDHGPDERRGDTGWDYALSASFDSAEAWEVYRDHPAHRALIAERFTPWVAERASVQFERPSA